LELGGLLSVSAFCLTFVFSVLLYENARIFEQHFSSPQDLARWYGFVAALASLVSLGLQFGLIPRLMRRFQLEQLSRFYVGALAASFVLLQALPALGPALLNELARWGVFGSLYEPMHFQIRGTLPTRQQAWARALLEGFSQNLGRLAASLSLLLMLAWGLPMLFIMALCLAALGAFVYANRQMLALYRQSIHSSLRSGQYAAFRRSVQEQLSFQQSIVQELLGRLAEVPPDDRDILLVAEALADTGAAAAFPLLLQKWPACPPGLQAELMLIMAEGWPQKAHRAELQKIVRQTLKSSDPRLCLAALRTVQIYPELLDSFLLAGRFLDPNPQISTLAAQLLLQHPSPSLSQAAQAHLKWLAASGAGGERALAVRALVEGGVDRYGQRFVSLDSPAFQVDPSVRVRMGIVPALKGQALIRSAMDMSPAVRHLALAQMQARPHRHLALLRTALQSSHHGSPASYRLAATLEEWYLWTALASLQPRALQKQVIPHLERGLHQLDLVASLYLSLQELQKPQLEALLNQLVLEYRALLQAILAFMGACYGQTRLRSISRTLEQAPDPLSCQMAENDLARLCRPDLAAQVAGILKNKTIRILKAHRPGIVHHPRHAYEQLLQQDDLWLELLALYCLSQLPPEQAADLITRPPLIADLLERGRHSPDDLIRAATQHVRTQLSPPDTTRYNPAYEEGRPMLSIIERMVFLRKVRFFENLRLDQLRTLARICEELSLNAGDYILHKGEAGDRLFIIVQGQIKILDPLSPQESLVLAIRQAGEVIGEISLFDGGLRSATGIAQSPALLLVVNRDSLYEAIADDPGIAMDMLRAMAESVRHNNQELIRLSTRINSQELHIIEEAIREAIEQD
jgi:CRP-like cAMP-binding protein